MASLSLNKQMHPFASTRTRLYSLALPGLICLALTSTVSALARPTTHRPVNKPHQHPVAAKWPHITTLNPNSSVVELGPDFGHDSTSHGSADNPPFVALVVLGSGFVHGSTIQWDKKPLVTRFVSPGRLETSIPEASLEDATFNDNHQAAVTVVNPGIKGHTSPPVPFTIDHWAMGDGRLKPILPIPPCNPTVLKLK